MRIAFGVFVLGLALAGCKEEGGTARNPAGTPMPQPADTAETPAEKLPVASECSGVTRGRDVVLSINKRTNAPPPFGGSIVSGTYDLVELHVYTGPEEVADDDHGAVVGAEAAQATLLVMPDAMRIATGAGQRNETAFAEERLATGWYHVEGNEIVYEEICPTRETRRIPYSTSGRALTLFTRPDRLEIYQLRE